jgi:single-strand DNA-binding protein
VQRLVTGAPGRAIEEPELSENQERECVMNETQITVIGNLAADPELKFVASSGDAVAQFVVISTPRYLDRQSGEWCNGESLSLRCSAWRELAEHLAESLKRGTRVLVSGRLRQRSYETRDGETRYVVELIVDEIGPSLRWATAKVTRVGLVREAQTVVVESVSGFESGEVA